MTLSVRDNSGVQSSLSHSFQNLLSRLVLLRAPSWRHSVSDGVLISVLTLLHTLWIPFGESYPSYSPTMFPYYPIVVA